MTLCLEVRKAQKCVFDYIWLFLWIFFIGELLQLADFFHWRIIIIGGFFSFGNYYDWRIFLIGELLRLADFSDMANSQILLSLSLPSVRPQSKEDHGKPLREYIGSLY